MNIELLNNSHDRSLFDCGETTLNDYLRLRARQHNVKGYGKTYVAVEDSPSILGYHTITTASVSTEIVPSSTPAFDIPVILLARLAVDRTMQGHGLGESLLLDALKKANEISTIAGAYAVTLDALNQNAKNFYLKYGFKELLDNEFHLYLPMTQVRNLFPQP